MLAQTALLSSQPVASCTLGSPAGRRICKAVPAASWPAPRPAPRRAARTRPRRRTAALHERLAPAALPDPLIPPPGTGAERREALHRRWRRERRLAARVERERRDRRPGVLDPELLHLRQRERER